MADRYLRIRTNDRDADLCTITSDGVITDIATPTEALLVIERLADQIRGAHTEAQKRTPGGMAARIKVLELENLGLREHIEQLESLVDESDGRYNELLSRIGGTA